jgi:hypothetical protein
VVDLAACWAPTEMLDVLLHLGAGIRLVIDELATQQDSLAIVAVFGSRRR